jgi:hypothetical protein
VEQLPFRLARGSVALNVLRGVALHASLQPHSFDVKRGLLTVRLRSHLASPAVRLAWLDVRSPRWEVASLSSALALQPPLPSNSHLSYTLSCCEREGDAAEQRLGVGISADAGGISSTLVAIYSAFAEGSGNAVAGKDDLTLRLAWHEVGAAGGAGVGMALTSSACNMSWPSVQGLGYVPACLPAPCPRHHRSSRAATALFLCADAVECVTLEYPPLLQHDFSAAGQV